MLLLLAQAKWTVAWHVVTGRDEISLFVTVVKDQEAPDIRWDRGNVDDSASDSHIAHFSGCPCKQRYLWLGLQGIENEHRYRLRHDLHAANGDDDLLLCENCLRTQTQSLI